VENKVYTYTSELLITCFWCASKLQSALDHTGWAKKVSLLIFAITLSTVSQFSYFLAHVHYKKLATRGCIVCPSNTVYVTALPCKLLIMTLPLCLYVCTRLLPIIITNTPKSCTLDMIHVKKQHNADYGTLL